MNAEYVERRCSSEGRWQVKPGSNSNNTQGWTNYTSCYLPEILDLMMKLGTDSEREVSDKKNKRKDLRKHLMLKFPR